MAFPGYDSGVSEAIAFDTHRFVKRLTDCGFTEQQAETLADEHVALLSANLATKADIGKVKADIAKLEVKIERVKVDLLKTSFLTRLRARPRRGLDWQGERESGRAGVLDSTSSPRAALISHSTQPMQSDPRPQP